MIKELIKLANELDERGLVKEAGILDKIIRMAGEDDELGKKWEDIVPDLREDTDPTRPDDHGTLSEDTEARVSFEDWQQDEGYSDHNERTKNLKGELFEKLFPFINLLLNTDLKGSRDKGTPEEQAAVSSFMNDTNNEDLAAIASVQDLFYGTHDDNFPGFQDEGWMNKFTEE